MLQPLLPMVERLTRHPGRKRHPEWLVFWGIPLAATLTGGNRNDVTQLIPLLQAVPPVRGERGRPRRRFLSSCISG